MSHSYDNKTPPIIPDERGIPSVNPATSNTKQRARILLTLLLMAIFLSGMGYWKLHRSKLHKGLEKKPETVLTRHVPVRTFATQARLSSLSDPLLTATSTPVASSILPALEHNATAQPLLDKSASMLMVVQETVSAHAASHPTAVPAISKEGSTEGLAAQLQGTPTVTHRATLLPHRNFLLAKGAFINCVLQTRLDSTVSGMSSCVVTQNIYSDTGKILLIEQGSTVTGEYASTLHQGMNRIFVAWNRVKTPYGVVVNLDSPGTDALGGSGIPGFVDTHFWARFGGALLLSLVDDVARGLVNQGARSTNQFNFNGMSNGMDSMAAEALKNTINIPPTLHKEPGAEVSIYVARDLDFSSVYGVALG